MKKISQKNSNVLNIPTNEGSDEETMFKKGENEDNLIVVFLHKPLKLNGFIYY